MMLEVVVPLMVRLSNHEREGRLGAHRRHAAGDSGPLILRVSKDERSRKKPKGQLGLRPVS